MERKLERNTIYYEMTQRLDKINKPRNEICSRPKLEPWHKRTQSPTKIETKQVVWIEWGVYNTHLIVLHSWNKCTFKNSISLSVVHCKHSGYLAPWLFEAYKPHSQLQQKLIRDLSHWVIASFVFQLAR